MGDDDGAMSSPADPSTMPWRGFSIIATNSAVAAALGGTIGTCHAVLRGLSVVRTAAATTTNCGIVGMFYFGMQYALIENQRIPEGQSSIVAGGATGFIVSTLKGGPHMAGR